MRVALLMVVCEGELEMAKDALSSFVGASSAFDISLFVLDDGSASDVGANLAAYFRTRYGLPVDCFKLPQSLGFRGSAERLAKGLQRVADSRPDWDLVIKLDADALVVRTDLSEFVVDRFREPTRQGLFGVVSKMRKRDRLLLLADLLPVGFRRRSRDGVLQRQWELKRLHPVWWFDIGRRALLAGFRFDFVPGCFFILGGDTLRVLHRAGFFLRDQSRHGFVFNDDVLLTIAVRALSHPVCDLDAPGWKGTMGMDESTSWELLEGMRPYVVHPLKDRPAAWQRREQLKRLEGRS